MYSNVTYLCDVSLFGTWLFDWLKQVSWPVTKIGFSS